MSDYAVIKWEGDEGGTYYIPVDQCEYIDKETLGNTGSSTIYLYQSPQAAEPVFIQIEPGKFPITQQGTLIQNVENVRFNLIGSVYYEMPLIKLGFLIICIFFMITAIIKKR